MLCKQQVSLIRGRRGLRIGLALAVLLVTFSVANAAEIYWATGNTGPWETPSNWTGGVVPGSGDIAHVTAGGTAQITSSTNANVNTLTLGSIASSYLGYIVQSGGSMNAVTEYIGESYMSGYVYTQNGGANTTGTMSLGYSSFTGWKATYNLNGGTLTTGSLVRASGSGTPIFNLGGGTLRASAGFTCSLPLTVVNGTTSKIDTQANTVTLSGGLSGSTGAITKIGSGTLALSGANSYAGGTTIGEGTLQLASTGSLAAGSEIKVAQGATYQVLISAGTSLSLYSRLTSTDPDALQLKGVILGGDIAPLLGHSMSMQWRVRSPDEINNVHLASDVLTLGTDIVGTTPTYVLGMYYNPALVPSGDNAYLSWYDGSQWRNAVDGNAVNNASGGELGYAGSFAAFQAAYGTDVNAYKGAYGFDATTNQAWAVLTHASSFGACHAAVPEPATLALLATALFGTLAYAWRKRR
jgi:autotransporter-associated beta strand protein